MFGIAKADTQARLREIGADNLAAWLATLPGRTDRSYGIHVARLAGMPRETVARAKEVLERLGKVEVADALGARVREVARAHAAPTAQLGLFTEFREHPVVGELRAVELESLTPLAAFDLLRKCVERARDGA